MGAEPQEDIKKNLANILGARIPGAQKPNQDIPEEESLPQAFVGKSKKSKKEKKKNSAELRDLSMPQTQASKNKVVYKEVGSQLHYHTSTGNWEVIEDLLESNPDAIECRSQDGRTILHVASSLGHKKIVTELLARNVDINSRMENGITPLMLCVAQGQNEIVSLLLKHNPDITIQTQKDGYTALHLAVMHQQIQGAKLLLEYDNKLNPPPVNSPTMPNNEGKKEKKTNSSKVAQRYIDLPSHKGYSALHLAIVENEMSMINVLLENNANTGAVTLRKWSPIHFAAHIGNEEICKIFLEKDPSVVQNKNDSGDTAWHVAMAKNHEHLLELLDCKKGKLKSKQSRGLLKRRSSFTKRSKKDKDKNTKKETIIIDETQNVSLLDMFKLPEFEGKEGESIIDAISENPELLQQMKENPEVFLKHLPRDMQELLIKDVEQNPYLLQEVVQMGKEVLEQVLEEHPEQLLSAMQNPFQLFKKANTPAKLLKLVRQLEENPMSVLKEEFQEDPELFLIKELRDNPRLLYLVVEKVRNTKPQLLPLIRVVMGVNPDDAKEPIAKDKGITGKMKNKVAKATINKFMKKMTESEDPELEKMNLGGIGKVSAEQEQNMHKFREFMKADAATNLAESGITGPLFTTEEYYVKVDEHGNEIPDEPEPNETTKKPTSAAEYYDVD